MHTVFSNWQIRARSAFRPALILVRQLPPAVRLTGLVLLAIAPVLILFVARIQTDAMAQIRLQHERASQLATMAADEQESLIAKTRVVLETLAHVPVVREARTPECHLLLGAVADRDSAFAGLWVLGLDGVPLCSSTSPRLSASVNATDRPYFQQVLRERSFVLSDLLITRNNQQPALVAAMPALDASGQIEAVLLATIDLPRLGRALDITLLQAARSETAPALLMVDATGVVLSWRSERPVPDATPIAAGQRFAGLLPKGSVGSTAAPGPDGIVRHWNYAEVAGTGVRILVGYANGDAAAAQWSQLLWALGLVMLAGGLAAGIGRWRLMQTVTRSAERLAEVARSIGQGGATLPPPATTSRSMGNLGSAADALATMAARLAEREAALLESESFLRSILSASTDCVTVLDAKGLIRFVNRQGLQLQGLTDAAELLGGDWTELWPEAERHQVHAAIAAAQAAGVPQRFEGSWPMPGGIPCWWDVTVVPMQVGHGAFRLVVVARDVTDRRAAEERLVLLVREVDHRAKNALAVALSLVRLAPRDDAAQFAAGVEGRIAAMARAHSLLAKGRWGGADLATLADGELAAYRERVTFDGPPARLAADAAQPVAMMLHELATNAAKHGALARPDGRLTLSWNFGGLNDSLRLCWAETGGPDVTAAPTRRGFGSRLLVSLVERQLGGRLGYDWNPAGLRLSIDLQARSAAPAEQTGNGLLTQPAPVAFVPVAVPGPTMTVLGPAPRILVVEDEVLLAMELEVMLRRLGCKVIGPARNLAEAMRMATTEPVLHAAILDVNLAGEMVFPVADLLATRGVPIVLATGYGSAESLQGYDREAIALLRKPYPQDALTRALLGALARTAPLQGVA